MILPFNQFASKKFVCRRYDGAACVCNVESLKNYSLHPPVLLGGANYHFCLLHRFSKCLPPTFRFTRYVFDDINSKPYPVSLATLSLGIPDNADSSFCTVSLDSIPSGTLAIFPLTFRFLLSGLLLILALARTLRESVDMHRATKQWQPNRYMTLLARHGTIYFFTYVNGFLHLPYPSPTTPFLSRYTFAIYKQLAHIFSR